MIKVQDHQQMLMDKYWDVGKKVLIGMLLSLCLNKVMANSHHPTDFLQQVADKPREGERIVEHYCATCHAAQPMIPLGAPRMRVLADWTPRVQQPWSQLWQHVDEGMHAMPPRGGCFECSDHQLYLAILALLPPQHARKIADKKPMK